MLATSRIFQNDMEMNSKPITMVMTHEQILNFTD